jgi:hypothetical protein
MPSLEWVHQRIGDVTLCFDSDPNGASRIATSKAVEQAARASRSPAVFVIDPASLAPAVDPDEFVRTHCAGPFEKLVSSPVCGMRWRALQFAKSSRPAAPTSERRMGLAQVGHWLGALPLRLEQEDAINALAVQCGYLPAAVERGFHARFWSPQLPSRTQEPPRTEIAVEP